MTIIYHGEMLIAIHISPLYLRMLLQPPEGQAFCTPKTVPRDNRPKGQASYVDSAEKPTRWGVSPI